MKSCNPEKQIQGIVVKERVFRWHDYFLFVLLSVLSFAAIINFMSYWFSLENWIHTPISFAVLTFIFIAVLLNNQSRWFLMLYMKRPRPIAARAGWKVAVVTTFVPGAEPLEMLEETMRALTALDYAHDTWVLDEGDDDQVKALCKKNGVHHFSRKNLPHYQTISGIFQSCSKHGNYNAWLYELGFEQYDIITAFDPDHVPEPFFLSRVLGYFADPQVGYVQVAQAYYNQAESFIARGAAEESYAYYSFIQMANYSMGYPSIIGCHNTHRVTALKQVGGFAPHDGDDLLITLFYQARGWQGVYIPQILARGLTPVDWSGYLTQQRRWARAILDIKLRVYPKVSRTLSFKARIINLLHGLNYLHRSIIIFAGLIFVAFMLATGIMPKVISYPAILKGAVLGLVLQLCEFYRQRFYLDWQNEWGIHWRAGILQLAKWPYFLLALYDVILANHTPYALTIKVRAKSPHYMLLWPNIFVIAFICTAWVIGMVSRHITSPLLHIYATIIVMSSLALILLEHLNFPEPYDKNSTFHHILP